jgi:hypothetical protein
LRKADLRGANGWFASLNNADLSRAKLDGAILEGSRLDGANLAGADLAGAYLSGASLSGASLIFTNLTEANLINADLTQADLSNTVFGNVDLTSVIGLEKCRHFGPSIVDHRTLQRSKSLPLQFLRGVGLPDSMIEYLPSLFNQAIQHYSCFISYSTKDDEFANRIYADLQNSGVRCWFARHDLPIGAKTWDVIDKEIKLRDGNGLTLKSAISAARLRVMLVGPRSQAC